MLTEGERGNKTFGKWLFRPQPCSYLAPPAATETPQFRALFAPFFSVSENSQIGNHSLSRLLVSLDLCYSARLSRRDAGAKSSSIVRWGMGDSAKLFLSHSELAMDGLIIPGVEAKVQQRSLKKATEGSFRNERGKIERRKGGMEGGRRVSFSNFR